MTAKPNRKLSVSPFVTFITLNLLISKLIATLSSVANLKIFRDELARDPIPVDFIRTFSLFSYVAKLVSVIDFVELFVITSIININIILNF